MRTFTFFANSTSNIRLLIETKKSYIVRTWVLHSDHIWSFLYCSGVRLTTTCDHYQWTNLNCMTSFICSSLFISDWMNFCCPLKYCLRRWLEEVIGLTSHHQSIMIRSATSKLEMLPNGFKYFTTCLYLFPNHVQSEIKSDWLLIFRWNPLLPCLNTLKYFLSLLPTID